MKRWMLWGAGVLIGFGWLGLWARWFSPAGVLGPPVALLVEMALMALVNGVIGGFAGAVGNGLWEIGRALVRVVRGEGMKKPQP